jgi:uncharacterized protein (TIGR01370 family)
MPVISSYALQFRSVSFAALAASPYDLIITEGAPLPRAGSVPAITDSEVAALRAQGRTVVGYVNVAVTDDNRGYWNSAWTADGTDSGALLPGAPAWLVGQPVNAFGRIANFNNLDWQTIVINQAKALVQRGYDGIFLDDVAAYFQLGNDVPSRQLLATQMANFVARIASEVRAINPSAFVVANADPFLTTNVTPDAAGAAARTAYLAAVDAHLLENMPLVGINQTPVSLPGEQLLFLFSNSAPTITLAEAWRLGIPYYAPTEAYDVLGSYIGAQTAGDDVLTGGSGPNFLRGAAGNDTISGGDGNDVLVGDSGNDTLSGGNGADELYGGLGNDVFITASRGTTIVEFANEGIDEVRASSSIFVLPDNVENLTYAGTGNFVGFGNALNNVITGGAGFDGLIGDAGDDTIRGGAGAANELIGGTGNDRYVVEVAGDTIIEYAGEGIDTVSTALASYTLRTNVENLTFTGTGSFSGVGTAENNAITGGAGADTLVGLDGNDVLTGGSGADLLLGGNGADQFRYNGGETGYDRIIDFTPGTDKIALAITGFARTGTLQFISGGAPVATTANSTFLYDVNTGIVSYDADGNGAGAAVQLAQLNTGLTLTVSDFVFL